MNDYFSTITQLKSDPIYGRQEIFYKDPRTTKINLSIGVLTNDDGDLHCFQAVLEAYKQITPRSFGYIPIGGIPKTAKLISREIFGSDQESSIAMCQSIGGTGALTLLLHLAKETKQIQKVAYLNPTWPNHQNIIREQGLSSLPLDNLEVETISKLEKNTLLLLQPCCNNPTGKTLSQIHWTSLIQALKERNILTLFDMAYFGLGKSMAEDSFALQTAIHAELNFLCAFSASKSMSLYNCRTGWAFVFAPSYAQAIESHLESYARATYSSPPALGSAIISKILMDENLKASWENELDLIRTRLKTTRKNLSDALRSNGYANDIQEGEGLFTKLPISESSVESLREKHALYIGLDGRINLGAIRNEAIEKLSQTLMEVLK